MKATIKIIIFTVLFTFFTSACQPSAVQAARSELPRNSHPSTSDDDMAAAVSGSNQLAFDLLHQLQDQPGNLFFSPFSISTALVMTYAGARGETESQMAQALHFTLPQESLHPAFNRLLLEQESREKVEELPDGKAFTLHIANSLWGQQGYPFEKSFLDVLAENYDAGMNLTDFNKDPESARKTINQWVSQETEKHIQDVIPPGAIDALTRLVLANAIYFKADWANEFEKEATGPGLFHLVDGNTISIPTMFQHEMFRYASGDGWQILEMPYAGNQVSMVVFLPDEGVLESAQSSLDAVSLNSLLENLEYRDILLWMPKFKYEYSLGLVDSLKDLGMTDAFDPTKADLSGMDGTRDLYITNILHKAIVAVDEAGTEAAAATVVIVGLTSAPPPEQPLEFRVDRPFLFLIRDNVTNTILFMGRVMNPALD
jgi:serpin B